MATELQVRYANAVEKRVYYDTIFDPAKGTCNIKYEGNPLAGAVKIPTRASATVADYDTSSGTDLENTPTVYKTVTIGNDKAVNQLIDDYENLASPDDVVADRLDDAGKVLAESTQTDASSELETNATNLGDTDAGSSYGSSVEISATNDNAYLAILAADEAMSMAKIPNDGRRVLIISPKIKNVIMQDSHFIQASNAAQTIMQTGNIGSIDGFNVFVCNFFQDTDSTAEAGLTEFIAYHPDWFAQIKEWRYMPQVEKVGNQYIGARRVAGRVVWAYSLIDSAYAFRKYYSTYSA